MWINRKLILGLAFVLLLSACATRKSVSTKSGSVKELSRKEKKSTLEGIENNKLVFETFSTKAKSKLSLDNKSFNATLNIRIKHNEVIWISANVFLGIEVARIMITPNRIQIINRLQSTYIDQPFDYIYNFTSKEVSFKELQSLFVGNSLDFYSNPLNTILNVGNDYKITGASESLNFEMNIGANYNLLQTKLSEKTNSQTVQFDYKEHGQIQSKSVPGVVSILLKAPNLNINAEMKYEDINLNQELSFPFTVPERYKKI